MAYREVPAKIDLPAMEHEVLQFWADKDVFHESLKKTADGPLWVFYEGPPTANGKPGTHHVEARVFKDVFPRYRTMKGFHVPRKAGWDCHGLPVELAVEKELGFTGKKDIEEFGIAPFNEKCRDSVNRHVDEFAAMTSRMGYWVDMDQAYWTMDPKYVDAVWWSLKRIFDKGLLVQDYRVSPYCPRCGTGLSDHELAQGYENIVDASVYVRLPLTRGAIAEAHPNAALLIWTTTPWTLISNTAAAVHPEVQYEVCLVNGEELIVAAPLREKVFGEEATVLATYTGAQLEGTFYQRPFEWVEFPDTDAPVNSVVLADYVTTEDGTGIVHQSPAYGADDYQVCRSYGMPMINPVRADGTFEETLPEVGGVFFKSADPRLVEVLQERGLLFKHLAYEHSYPHCWRCHTALIYYAQPSWYIRTTAIKDELLTQNEGTNWFPETIKWGRYGDWLHNNIDWALSRNRYWGTPLPIWRCSEGHLKCIGGRKELAGLAGDEYLEMDPHRPFVDDVTFACAECSTPMTRVPEVIDGWFDSGAMPFAQWGYPEHDADETFAKRYPADFICEAIDQTRGWFYTLMAVGTLVFGESSYKNVLCLGHILDEDGRKMSKHLGNVLEPIPLMDEHGADALRWFMLASGSPWQARRVGHNTIAEVVRKTLLTYWNTVAFQSLYARASSWTPGETGELTIMDEWARSEAMRMAREVDHALEAFDTQRAGRLIAEYVDDLSNWYVRRSRRRFWDGDAGALSTLHECLKVVTQVMAPFTPFITERVWQDLFATDGTSVHLSDWPKWQLASIDDQLRDQMQLTRRIVELGRAARAASSVRTRQPLSRALVGATGWAELPEGLQAQIRDEVNVLSLDSLSNTGELVDVSLKANFKALGARFGKRTPDVANAIAAANAEELVAALRIGQSEVIVDGNPEVITLADVVVTEVPREGWTVASENGETLALDLEISEDLLLAGLAREATRLIQEARKQAGLEITDRISVTWQASDEITQAALLAHGENIAREVLATAWQEGSVAKNSLGESDLGLAVELNKN